MPLTREQALAALGLAARPDADTAAVQAAFERLARRYPQPHFPDRFRQLLEARDQLMSPDRSWRDLLEARSLDLTWVLPHLSPPKTEAAVDRKTRLQALMRAGLLAEPADVPMFGGGWLDDDDDDDEDDDDDDDLIPF